MYKQAILNSLIKQASYRYFLLKQAIATPMFPDEYADPEPPPTPAELAERQQQKAKLAEIMAQRQDWENRANRAAEAKAHAMGYGTPKPPKMGYDYDTTPEYIKHPRPIPSGPAARPPEARPIITPTPVTSTPNPEPRELSDAPTVNEAYGRLRAKAPYIGAVGGTLAGGALGAGTGWLAAKMIQAKRDKQRAAINADKTLDDATRARRARAIRDVDINSSMALGGAIGAGIGGTAGYMLGK